VTNIDAGKVGVSLGSVLALVGGECRLKNEIDPFQPVSLSLRGEPSAEVNCTKSDRQIAIG
jgi:hypothetical protein